MQLNFMEDFEMATAVKAKVSERSEKSASGGIVLQVGALRDALGRAKLAAKRNASIPQHECVRLKAVGGKMTLQCNADVAISTTVGVIKFEPIDCLVSAERLLGILKTLHAASDVLLRLDGTGLIVTCTRSTWILQTVEDTASPEALSEKKFPLFGKFIGEHFVRVLNHVCFACEMGSTRYALGGVFFERTKSNIIIVATDGRRMCTEILDNDGGEVEMSCLVPFHVILMLMRVSGSGSVAMRVGAHGARFDISHDDGEETTVASAMLAGAFPKWRSVLPTAGVVSTTTLSRDSFLSAVRQAAITTSDESRGIKMSVSGLLMIMSGISQEIGQSTVFVEVESMGTDVAINIDPNCVVDWLSSLDVASSVVIDLIDDKSAMVLKSDTATCVVMPISKE